MPVRADAYTESRLAERLGAMLGRTPTGSYDLRAANLTRLSLTKARLAGCDARGAMLRGCDLQRADLSGADLRGADLTDAKLNGADLRNADLGGATLERAALVGAEVAGSCWGEAVLRGAHLQDLALWRTDLRPEAAAEAAEVRLAEALTRDLTSVAARAGEPLEPQVLVARVAAWCRAYGGPAEAEALAHVLPQLRRRLGGPAAQALDAVLVELRSRDRRAGAASLSRARHDVIPSDTGLSRGGDLPAGPR